MSPSKAKGTNLTNRREGIVANRREVRGEVLLLRVAVCLKEATKEGFVDLAAATAEERGGGVGGRKMGALKTVAIESAVKLRVRVTRER